MTTMAKLLANKKELLRRLRRRSGSERSGGDRAPTGEDQRGLGFAGRPGGERPAIVR
jgi:hypothetical protein